MKFFIASIFVFLAIGTPFFTNAAESFTIGQLLRAQGDIKVYVLNEHGYRRHIPSPEAFNSYGFDWDAVKDIPKTEIEQYPETKLIRIAGGIEVYRTVGQEREWITNPTIFEESGFDWNAIIVVTPEDANNFNRGVDITKAVPAVPATPAQPAIPTEPQSEEPIPTQPATPAQQATPAQPASPPPPPASPPTPTCSEDTWTCGSWSTCSTSGQQTRSCTMTNDCSAVTTVSPITTQSCMPSLASIVQDDFNSYTNGSIVDQGFWQSYVNGGNWLVQETTTFEGVKALYNNTPADSLVGKAGTLLSDGRQAAYIKSSNRSSWHTDAGLGVKISKELNSSGAPGLAFAAVDFKKDGNVRYYDQGSDVYRNFDTYNDNEWTLLEVEWRSSDKKARYRVNSGAWTDWYTFVNTASFTGFNYVNFDFYLPGGSGKIYVDNLY